MTVEETPDDATAVNVMKLNASSCAACDWLQIAGDLLLTPSCVDAVLLYCVIHYHYREIIIIRRTAHQANEFNTIGLHDYLSIIQSLH